MTAEEYLKPLYTDKTITTYDVVTYGDLRAKEAVKEFAEELAEQCKIDSSPIIMKINNLAKQKGVEI